MPHLGRRSFATLTLVVAVGVGGAVAATPSAPKVATFECDYSMRTPTFGVIESATLTMKGKMVRYRKRSGAGLKLLYLRNRNGTYHLNQYTNDGAKWPASWAKDLDSRLVIPGPQGDPQVFFKVADARRTGRERVNGKLAEVWTYKLPTKYGKPQEVRVFLDARTKCPLKTVARTLIAPGRFDTITVEYRIYRWNFPLPDSFFDLPKGAKIANLDRVDPHMLNPASDRKR